MESLVVTLSRESNSGHLDHGAKCVIQHLPEHIPSGTEPSVHAANVHKVSVKQRFNLTTDAAFLTTVFAKCLAAIAMTKHFS